MKKTILTRLLALLLACLIMTPALPPVFAEEGDDVPSTASATEEEEPVVISNDKTETITEENPSTEETSADEEMSEDTAQETEESEEKTSPEEPSVSEEDPSDAEEELPKQDIQDAEILFPTDDEEEEATETAEFVFTGDFIIPEILVRLGEEELEEEVDYVVECEDNRNVGEEATIRITGIGLYEGELEKTFTILSASTEDLTVDPISNQAYTGEEVYPEPTVRLQDVLLEPDTDYTLSYEDNVLPGTATLIITGTDNLVGEAVCASFTIDKGNIAKATVGGLVNKTYTGAAQTQTPTVSWNGTELRGETDYTLSYKNNTNAGTATVTVTGKGIFAGTLNKTFTIAPLSIASASVTGVANKTYNGSAQTQTLTVKVGSTTLKNGTDYTLSYKDNKNAGKATVTVTGKGNYTGTVSKTFTIDKKANTITASNITKGYSTRERKFSIGATAQENPKMTYKSNNGNISVNSSGTVTVKPDYTGTATITISSATTTNYKAATKSITVTVSSSKKDILVTQVVEIMDSWIGGGKNSPQQKEILSLYNSQPNLPRGVYMYPSYAWCAATVSAAWIKAGIINYTTMECGCGSMIKLAKAKGIWVENDAYVPKVGDAIIYDWDDNGVGDDTTGHDHVGIVVAVNGSKSFTVVEGNKGDEGKVGVRQMNVNGQYIRGFIAPDYAAIATKVTPKHIVTNAPAYTSLNDNRITVQAIADQTYTGKALTPQLVIKDGNTVLKAGTDYTIQYSDNKLPGRAKISLNGRGKYTDSRSVYFTIKGNYSAYLTKQSVNYRTGPGLNYGVVGTLKSGASVQVLSGFEQKANGYTWCRVLINNKNYYIANQYLKKAPAPTPAKTQTTSAPQTTTTTKTVYTFTTTDSLNFRRGVGLNYGVAGTLKKGATVEVLSENAGKANGYTWAKVKVGGSTYYVANRWLKKTAKTVTVAAPASQPAQTSKTQTTQAAMPAESKPQTTQPAQTPQTKTVTTYTTTASLNYRKGIGLGYGVAGTLKKGTKVEVVKESAGNASGYTWAQVKVNGGTYYVANRWLKKTQTTVTVSEPSSQAKAATTPSASTSTPTTKASTPQSTVAGTKTTTVGLNFRKGAGLGYGVAGTLPKGTKVQVLSDAAISANGYQWVKIRYKGGDYYVASKYLR